MSATYDFTGKKVLVTGASQGIGYDICKQMSAAGAQVFALARNKEALEKLAAENKNVTAIPCDVTAPREVITEALAAHQPFDYLVNNAGIAVLEPLLEATEENIDRVFTVNLRAPIIMAQIVAKQMIAHSVKGAIVNVSSLAALKPLANFTAYCSAKAGLDMATRCMTTELCQYGIRVNSVNPTIVFTEMGRQAWTDSSKSDAVLKATPIPRFAETEDVINSIKFLLSNESAMTTGSFIPVDGGNSSQ